MSANVQYTAPSLNFIRGNIQQVGNKIGNPIQPDSTITYIDPKSGTTTSITQKTPPFIDGRLIFGLLPQDDENNNVVISGKTYYPGPHRAYIYLDCEDNNGYLRRFTIGSPIDASFNLDKKNLQLQDIQGTNIANKDLPFLYCNEEDTKKGDLIMQDASLLMHSSISNTPTFITFETASKKNMSIYLTNQCLNIGTIDNPRCTIDYEGNISASNNLSLKGDKATLSYNNITQSLDFIFN